jgi:hypothetical protein
VVRTRRGSIASGLAIAALLLVAVPAAAGARPFLSQARVEAAATSRAAEICAANSKCTQSSAQCDQRVARNAFSCYINTFYPGHTAPFGKDCYFINLWVLTGHPPKLTHRRFKHGSYPGGPYGIACEIGPD